MADAFEAAGELVLIAGLLVCIGLLYGAKYLSKALRTIFGFSVFGIRPLGWLVDQLAGLIEDGANAGIKASEKVLAGLFSAMIDSLGILIGAPIALALALKDALSYLWNHALEPRVLFFLRPLQHLVDATVAKLTALATTVVKNLAHAEAYARAEAAGALSDAKAYAEHQATIAEHAAESYADTAVSALRTAEHTALANAIRLEHDALTSVDTALQTAIAGVAGVAGTAERDIGELVGPNGILGAAALIAAIPALSALVHTLATDTGLENQDCRQKVKGICGTDPSRWAKLLGELALLGASFDLKLVYDVANAVIGELGDAMIQLEDAAWGQFA